MTCDYCSKKPVFKCPKCRKSMCEDHLVTYFPSQCNNHGANYSYEEMTHFQYQCTVFEKSVCPKCGNKLRVGISNEILYYQCIACKFRSDTEKHVISSTLEGLEKQGLDKKWLLNTNKCAKSLSDWQFICLNCSKLWFESQIYKTDRQIAHFFQIPEASIPHFRNEYYRILKKEPPAPPQFPPSLQKIEHPNFPNDSKIEPLMAQNHSTESRSPTQQVELTQVTTFSDKTKEMAQINQLPSIHETKIISFSSPKTEEIHSTSTFIIWPKVEHSLILDSQEGIFLKVLLLNESPQPKSYKLIIETSPLKKTENLTLHNLYLAPNKPFTFEKHVIPAQSGTFEFRVNLIKKTENGNLAWESEPKYLPYQEKHLPMLTPDQMIAQFPHVTKIFELPSSVDPFLLFHSLFSADYHRRRLAENHYQYWITSEKQNKLFQINYSTPCELNLWSSEPEIDIRTIENAITRNVDIITKAMIKEKEKVMVTNTLTKYIITIQDMLELGVDSNTIKRNLNEIYSRLVKIPEASILVQKYKVIFEKLEIILSRTLLEHETESIDHLLVETQVFIESILR